MSRTKSKQADQTAEALPPRGFGSATPSFVLLGVALLLWSVAASLSSYLAEDFERHGHGKSAARGPADGAVTASDQQHGKAAGESAAAAPELAELRKAAEADPKDAQVRVRLGYELVQKAHAQSDSSLLMEAVQVLGQALQIDPANTQALLGLATLTLQAGVVDKALELYPRYLQLEPGDSRARTDYALALVESKNFPAAEAQLNQVLKAEPESIPAHMTYAYRYKVENNFEKAKEHAASARKAATDDETRRGIDSFVAGLAADDRPGAAVPITSPATRVSDFFRSHAIVGPKVRAIRWSDEKTALIELEDFPVEAMPDFAKAKFIGNITKSFEDLPEAIQIKLLDAGSQRELLVIPVGASGPGK